MFADCLSLAEMWGCPQMSIIVVQVPILWFSLKYGHPSKFPAVLGTVCQANSHISESLLRWYCDMAVSTDWGSLCGCLRRRALLFGGHVQAPDFLATPMSPLYSALDSERVVRSVTRRRSWKARWLKTVGHYAPK